MQIYPLDQIRIQSVVRIASQRGPGEHIYFTQSLPHYELIYNLSGNNHVHYCGRDGTDAADIIRFMPREVAGDCYRVDIREVGECIDVYFDTDEPLPKEMLLQDYSERTALRRLFIQMERCWHRHEIGYKSQCLSMFYAVLAEMEIADRTYVPDRYRQRLSPALEYIHSHYHEASFDFALLPRLCGIGDTYFRKLFLRVYGELPSEYVRSLKLKYACELLHTRQFPVTQISEMCGYQDVSYFSKVFKKEIGLPPSEYARE